MLTGLLCVALLGLGAADIVVAPFAAHADAPVMTRVSLGAAGGWGLDAAGTVFHMPLGGAAWEQMDGEFVEISSGGTEVWAVCAGGKVYKRAGAAGAWEEVAGELMASVDVSDNDAVWALAADDTIHRYLRETGEWSTVGGFLKTISTGPSGVWGVDKYGDTFHRKGTFGGADTRGIGWKPVPGKMKWVSTGVDTVFGANDHGEIMYRTGVTADNYLGDSWIYIAGDFAMVDSWKGHLLALDNNGVLMSSTMEVDDSATVVSSRHDPLDLQNCGDGDDFEISAWEKIEGMVFGDSGYHGHYAIDTEGKLWYSKDGSDFTKEPDFDAIFTYVSVGKTMLWACDKVGHTFVKYLNVEGGDWERHIPPLNEEMMQISVSEYDVVWATTFEQSIYKWQQDRFTGEGSWMRIFGRAKVASIGPSGVWVITHNDDIYARKNTRGIESAVGSGWNLMDGKSKHIASGHNIVFSTNSVDNVFRRVGINDGRPYGTHWAHVDGKLRQLDVYKNTVYGFDVNQQAWRATFKCTQA